MKNKQHKPIIALDKNSNKAFDFLIDENGKYTHNSKELDFKIDLKAPYIHIACTY